MLPQDIEQESFRIIRDEMEPHRFGAEELAVVVRVIHATGDFEYARQMRFHPRAIRSGIEALTQGCTIVTDVRMCEVGISSPLVSWLGNRTVCDISNRTVRREAVERGLTRATLAMRRNAAPLHGGIAVVGNAPTALLEVIRLVREGVPGRTVRPALIVGVPVGFVNAAESKDELATLDVPYITSLGRKGGSSVAAAIVNALLHMATERAKAREAGRGPQG